MATINVPITIPDGTQQDRLRQIEKRAGRPRDPETGDPLSTPVVWIGSLCSAYLNNLARQGLRIENREYNQDNFELSSPDPNNDITGG